MLNRRSLRVKVMQSLFALQQCKDANYELCLEKISDSFLPDLNSMEVQDKAQLTLEKKQATKLFEKTFLKGDTSVDHENIKINLLFTHCVVVLRFLRTPDRGSIVSFTTWCHLDI